MRPLLRWSAWGQFDFQMLTDSINSFKYWFKDSADYLVCTDNPDLFKNIKLNIIKIDENSPYFIKGTLWNKWAPGPRLAVGQSELYIDSDIFCLNKPTELINFLNIPGKEIITLKENKHAWRYYGNFAEQLKPYPPLVNAGLVGQQSLMNITDELFKKLNWLKQNVPFEEWKNKADEQGAIACVCRKYRSVFLPIEKYRLISASATPFTNTVEDLVLFHGTHSLKGYPAYNKFRKYISGI